MRALLPLLAACSSSSTPTWHVDKGFVRDPEGRAVIMRGANVSGTQKMAPYLDEKTPADFQRIRNDWGMNAIRWVMPWAAIEKSPGVYDDAYLDRVIERLSWANDAGLLVVIDMHQDIYGEGFGFDGAPRWACDEARYAAFVRTDPWFLNTLDPQVMACFDELYTNRVAEFTAMWRHVAERLAPLPNVIGFDVLNEPSWGSYAIFKFEKERLAPFYAQVVAAVREVAPHWIAFLEPGASRNTGIATSLVELPDNSVYSPHSYDSTAESGGGFDPTHRQMILDNVAELAAEAHTLNAGLWIGEYGGMADHPGIVEYMTAQYDAAGAVAGSTMYWAYDSGGYGLIDEQNREKQPLVDTLVRPYPERVAGDPIAYSFDGAFTLTYEPHGDGPTIIAVPARTFATYTVECGGCSYHQEPGRLFIDSTARTVKITGP